MKTILLLLGIIAFSASESNSQIAQGPAAGSVASGAVVNTNNYADFNSAADPGPIHVHPIVPLSPQPANMTPPTAPEGSNLFADPSLQFDRPPGPPPITLASFQGNNQTSGVPPDPCVAVGPNHIMHLVNSSFRISDKNGNTLKTISADSWFNSVLPSNGAFDPRVFYDTHANRWFMVWDNQNDVSLTAYFLVSVSDDDNPLGVWFNWALPANVFGSTNSGTWQDHETAGFDSRAYYITGRHFGYVSGYYRNAVRVLPKAQFLGSTPGPITWWDFWSLRDLGGNDVDMVRPSFVYSNPNEYYLAGPPSFSGGSYFALFRITNPLGTPAISCVHVPVTAWSEAPLASQLGGGTPLESGGSRVRSEPIYRDSSLWVAHSINNGGYSAVRYIRINTPTNTAVEDAAMGALGYWHFYPAMVVDKDNNIGITFSRSAETEYVGAYYTWRLSSDPAGQFRPTETMRPGAGNYVISTDRNRWGDYMGAALDPSDKNNMWFLTQYTSGPNSFGVWVNGVRVVPFPGSRIRTNSGAVDFGNVEAGFTSDTTTITITNLGASTLTISSIARTQTTYSLLNLPTFPANIATYDSLKFRAIFRPVAHGVVNDTITLACNDVTNPNAKVALRGKGIVIGTAQRGTMYATSAFVDPTPSRLYTLNLTTGAATPVGQTGVNEIDGLAVRASTRELYGVFPTATGTTLYRISSLYGDALFNRALGIPNLRAIAFTPTGDTLYGGTSNGRLYRINAATGDTSYIGTAQGKSYNSFSISPTSGQLWATGRSPIFHRDSIYFVSRTTGAATAMGRTGLGSITPSIAFDKQGRAYAIIGISSQTNTLYSLDTLTGLGTLIGSTNVAGLQAMAMRTDSSGSVGVVERVPTGIPETFSLKQNYPNPFNPTTQIRYGLPVQSRVAVTVYNIMGQEVARLYEGAQTAGYHEVVWNGMNSKGGSVASGIYLYKLEANGEGRTFTELKKMLLLK